MTALSWCVALWLAMPGVVVTWLVTGFRTSPVGEGAICMAIRLDDDSISMEVHGCVAAITRLRHHAAADGHGARIVGDRLVSTLRQELR